MEFRKAVIGGSSRSARLASKASSLEGVPSSLELQFPSPLQFYDIPPKDDISLQEFELLAVERLRLLRIFEKHASLSASKYSAEWRDNIEREIKKSGLDSYLAVFEKNRSRFENRRRDNFSHFILRLAYCRTEELRRWFLSQETDLLRFRYNFVNSEEIAAFSTENNLNFVPIDDEEKNSVIESLNQCVNFGQSSPSTTNYFKVHFTEALDLVRNRRVFLRNGMCYVPEYEMLSLLTWIFKSLLTQNLALTAKILPNLDEDERLVRMLANLDKRYTESDYGVKDGVSVKPEMIKDLSEKSFPPCMKAMQRTLSKTHHLKYRARLQYGLFLKGIGLALDDAIRFFRSEFTKSHVDADKFDKEYTYGIRYNYGYEGKKVNWAPWNCMRIIMENVSPGENHGCPFRHHDSNVLKDELDIKDPEELKEVMSIVKDGHYQRACACNFKAVHGYELSSGITNHPNQYYLESVGDFKANATSNQNSNIKTEKVLIYNS